LRKQTSASTESQDKQTTVSEQLHHTLQVISEIIRISNTWTGQLQQQKFAQIKTNVQMETTATTTQYALTLLEVSRVIAIRDSLEMEQYATILMSAN